jgi:transposase
MATITLTADERTARQQLVQTTRAPRGLKRAQALRWLAAGAPLPGVARRLFVSRPTIYPWSAMYQHRADQPRVNRLADRQRSRPGQGRTWRAARDLVQAVIDHQPSLSGYAGPRWTTPLLQDYLRAQGLPISTRYIRRLLRALN